MGRRKKQADIEEAIEDTKKLGHNGADELTDDEKRALFFQHKKSYERDLAAKKAAGAALKNTCKKAKAECGKDAVSDIKDAIEFEADDGHAKFTAEIERKHRVARWLGLPVGTSPRFFDDFDGRPSVDVAYDNGKQSGMAGSPCQPPHDPSVPQYQKWISGWHDGQAILASAFSKLKTEPVEGAAVNDADVSDPPFAAPPDDRVRGGAEAPAS